MIISRVFCRPFFQAISPHRLSRSFAHKPIFGPHSQQTYQLFREIKERQLAKIFCQSSSDPNDILTTIFAQDIGKLEMVGKKKLHSSITDRIWDAISPQKLNLLNETYTKAVQDTVLKTCSEKEIEQLLREYDQGWTISPKLRARFIQVYKEHEVAIRIVLKREAEKIRKNWMSELIEVAEKEGIRFPKSMNRQTTPT